MDEPLVRNLYKCWPFRGRPSNHLGCKWAIATHLKMDNWWEGGVVVPFGMFDRLGICPVKGAYSWTAWEGSRTKSRYAPQTTPTRKPGKAWLRPRRRPAAVEPSSSSLAGDTWVGLTHLGRHIWMYATVPVRFERKNLVLVKIRSVYTWCTQTDGRGAIRASSSPHVWNCSVLHNLWSCSVCLLVLTKNIIQSTLVTCTKLSLPNTSFHQRW